MKLQNVHPIQWRNWLKAWILLGTGLYLFILILTGNVANYINLSFQWLTVVGAVLFLIMGLWQVWQMRNDHHDHDHHDHHDHHHHNHDHETTSWSIMLIVAIPLAFGALIPSSPLGADAITGGVSLQPVGVSDRYSASKSPLERHILDWLREFQSIGNPTSLDGTPVDVTGFIYREPNMAENEFMIARFTLSCCVADAFAIGIPVIYDDAGTFETGVWVRIQGTLQAGAFDGDSIPIIRPTRIDPVEQPEQPYLYS